MSDIPLLTTPEGISRRSGLHRLTVLRVLNNQLVRPDAWLERGEDGTRVPLLKPERAIEILRHVRSDERRRAAAAALPPTAGDAPA